MENDGDRSGAPREAGVILGGVELGSRPWLVLGGGGLKGLGHLGAWKVLQDVGFTPAGILGASMGAVAGAAIALGCPLEELRARALELRRADLARVHPRALWVNGMRAPSILRGDVFRRYVSRTLALRRPNETSPGAGGPGWTELLFPFQVNAVELGSGEPHWFGPGARTDASLLDAVLASASLPVLYPPVKLPDDLYYVDGGVADALPLERARELGATGIVAVDVGSADGAPDDGAEAVRSGLVAVHRQVFSMMIRQRRRDTVTRWEGPPLLYVRPRLEGYDSFDFQHREYFMEEGERAMRHALGRLKPATAGSDPAP